MTESSPDTQQYDEALMSHIESGLFPPDEPSSALDAPGERDQGVSAGDASDIFAPEPDGVMPVDGGGVDGQAQAREVGDAAREAEVSGDKSPDGEQDQDSEQEHERPGIKQVRLYARNEEDLEVLRLCKGGLSIREAQELLAQRQAILATEPAPAAPLPSLDTLEGMQARIAQLDHQLEDAGSEQSLMTPDIVRAIQERADLAARLLLERRDSQERERVAEAHAQSEFDTNFQESSNAVMSLYPAAGDPYSDLSAAINAEVQAILSTDGHPLRGNPEAPMILAAKHARRLGIPPVTGHAPSGGRRAEGYQYSAAYAGTRGRPEAMTPRYGLEPATGAARTAPAYAQPTTAMVEAEFQRRFASAGRDEEAAGILAASLFGSAVPGSPFDLFDPA